MDCFIVKGLARRGWLIHEKGCWVHPCSIGLVMHSTHGYCSVPLCKLCCVERHWWPASWTKQCKQPLTSDSPVLPHALVLIHTCVKRFCGMEWKVNLELNFNWHPQCLGMKHSDVWVFLNAPIYASEAFKPAFLVRLRSVLFRHHLWHQVVVEQYSSAYSKSLWGCIVGRVWKEGT